MNVSELPGPLQAVWNDVYQLVVKNLRAEGVDLPIAKSRARRAAEEHVELMWDETKHPRWAVGTGVGPGGEGGGRFRPKAGGAGVEKKDEDEEEDIDKYRDEHGDIKRFLTKEEYRDMTPGEFDAVCKEQVLAIIPESHRARIGELRYEVSEYPFVGQEDGLATLMTIENKRTVVLNPNQAFKNTKATDSWGRTLIPHALTHEAGHEIYFHLPESKKKIVRFELRDALELKGTSGPMFDYGLTNENEFYAEYYAAKHSPLVLKSGKRHYYYSSTEMEKLMGDK